MSQKWIREGRNPEQTIVIYPCSGHPSPDGESIIECPRSLCRVENCGGEEDKNLGFMTQAEAEKKFSKNKIYLPGSHSSCPFCYNEARRVSGLPPKTVE